MWITWLPLVTVSVPSATPAAAPEVAAPSPKSVQRQLAEALATADSIDAVHAHDRTVSFAITRAGTAFSIDATTRPSGEVVSLVVSEAPGARVSEHGGLTWLGDELASGRVRVTRLVVDDDGATREDAVVRGLVDDHDAEMNTCRPILHARTLPPL